ncbi:hypothetical protein B566_EDAN014559 [Ephemera danica]|nr:hypothetical protein B566_EDAN014559 [Ephemera danica]
MSVDWGPYQCDMDDLSAGGNGEVVSGRPQDKCGRSSSSVLVAIDARGWRRQSWSSSLVLCACVLAMLCGGVAAQLRPDTDISTQSDQGESLPKLELDKRVCQQRL